MRELSPWRVAMRLRVVTAFANSWVQHELLRVNDRLMNAQLWPIDRVGTFPVRLTLREGLAHRPKETREAAEERAARWEWADNLAVRLVHPAARIARDVQTLGIDAIDVVRIYALNGVLGGVAALPSSRTDFVLAWPEVRLRLERLVLQLQLYDATQLQSGFAAAGVRSRSPDGSARDAGADPGAADDAEWIKGKTKSIRPFLVDHGLTCSSDKLVKRLEAMRTKGFARQEARGEWWARRRELGDFFLTRGGAAADRRFKVCKLGCECQQRFKAGPI